MARKCVFTGKQSLFGNNVSHAHNKTRRKQLSNICNKKLYVEELGKTIRVKVSAAALRTIDKIGFMTYLRKKNLTLKEVS